MKNKRILSALTALLTATSLVSGVSVYADSASKVVLGEKEYATGLIPMNEEEYQAYLQTLNFDNEFTRSENTRASLPSSVDLSTTKYFPAIGDQGNYGSCGAWATTYYQFTYEVNKLHNTTATSSTTYSPSYTWNYINEGADNGSNFYKLYTILEQRGAATIDAMPYNGSNHNFNWLQDQDALLDALSVRKKSISNSMYISGTGTPITSNTDSDLNAVKTALNSGKVLTVTTNMEYNDKTATNSNDMVIYRFYEDAGESGHALTVVGYNDNICCDVNGNGTIESSERGAFKIANSWGTDWGNDGYVWVLYDALNKVSANTTNSWESNLAGERNSAFTLGLTTNNFFQSIDVEDKEVNFVGRFDLTTNYRYLLDFSISRDSDSFYAFNSNIVSSDVVMPFSGPILIDFGNCPNGDDPYSFYSGSQWKIRLGSGRTTWNASTSSFKVIDNKGNTIKNIGSLSGSDTSVYQTINLVKGDLNYDGVVNIADLATLNQYVSGGDDNLSNVAKCLADFDNNKVVNSTDLNTLSNMLLGRSIL